MAAFRSRVPVAVLAGLLFFLAWVAGSVSLADQLGDVHWAVRLAYFVVAGFAWVFPIRWLMLWAARLR
ncbi:MAG TPA: DUF2842 domain-containing protein [Acetobacteraceae bacterium]|nr:DUF2842 domain-containing protein [Acetobacteraceae bacterium]